MKFYRFSLLTKYRIRCRLTYFYGIIVNLVLFSLDILMALVTVQRALPFSASTDHQISEAFDEADSYKEKAEVKKQRSVSECYFVVKGAALILPHDECMHAYRKTNNGNAKSCDIQLHLKSMFYLLRNEDTLRMAVKLESMHAGRNRYLVVVSCNGDEDREESCLLGIDCANKTTIGLVLPVWADTHITLDGDGGFSVSSSGRNHIFKPVSVQAMWSALQTLHKSSAKAREYNYFTGGGTHQWVNYYEKCIQSDRSCLNEWHAMDDLESRRPPSPDTVRSKPREREATEKLIRTKLKELMMSVDLDEVTSKFIRTSLEEELDMNLNEYKSFIDTEMLMILGQMDAPTEIFEYLYLGSEWNASNLDELKANGVDHILNVTREIDNFFPGMFDYLNVRVYDDESTEMLKYWDKTFKYIRQVKSQRSKVLVHCKMGISRSASVVIAYVMKAYDWNLQQALDFVKNKRNCIKPNQGFVKQLEIYQGILDASKQRHNSLWRSKSETNLKSEDRPKDPVSKEDEDLNKKESAFHLSLPGPASRPKSWSPDDNVADSLFPPLIFDRPFQPLRQRSGTDPSCYIDDDNVTSEVPNENIDCSSPTVPRVSSIKDRINELESQAGSVTECQRSNKNDSKSIATSKSNLVLNLATQFEGGSKPSTPTSEDEVNGDLISSKLELLGVEPVISQTKPPVSKHQAVLVKPTWSQDSVQCNIADVENCDGSQTNFLGSQLLLDNEDDKRLTIKTVGSQPNHQTNKASHSTKDLRRQCSGGSDMSSPKSIESLLWSRQSSCSSSGVCSPPILQKDSTGELIVSNSVLVATENLINKNERLSQKCDSPELLTDIKLIQSRLLMGEESIQCEKAKELIYIKEDIPWTPGTVRRTKQQIESNTLKRTTSFDSAFPTKSRSTPSTPPELCSQVDSPAVTRSHSMHNEQRHSQKSPEYRKAKYKTKQAGHRPSMPHSLSTPSVVEAVNQVICGTKNVLTSAMQSLPSPELTLETINVASVFLDLRSPQLGIVKQNCEILESLTPKSTSKSLDVKTKKEQIRLMKEFGKSLVTEEEGTSFGGVVKRLTKELEAKAGSPGHKKERIVIVENTGSSTSVPTSPNLCSRVTKEQSSCTLRRSRTSSDAANRNSAHETSSTPHPPRNRKTSLDLDKFNRTTGDNGDTSVLSRLPPVNSNGLHEKQSFKMHTLNSTGRPPPAFKCPAPPPPLPGSGEQVVKKARKLQQGKSHPLSKLTVKQRHANPLYNTM